MMFLCSWLSCHGTLIIMKFTTADYHGHLLALALSTKHYEPCALCCRDLYDSQLAQVACPGTASRAVSRLLAFCQQSEQPVVLASLAERRLSMIAMKGFYLVLTIRSP